VDCRYATAILAVGDGRSAVFLLNVLTGVAAHAVEE
jgi:hypothetical protein